MGRGGSRDRVPPPRYEAGPSNAPRASPKKRTGDDAELSKEAAPKAKEADAEAEGKAEAKVVKKVKGSTKSGKVTEHKPSMVSKGVFVKEAQDLKSKLNKLTAGVCITPFSTPFPPP